MDDDLPPTRGRGRSFYGNDVDNENTSALMSPQQLSNDVEDDDLPLPPTRVRGRSFYGNGEEADEASNENPLAPTQPEDEDDDFPPLAQSRARGRSFYGNQDDGPTPSSTGSTDEKCDVGELDGSKGKVVDGGISMAMRMAEATQRAMQQDVAAAQIQKLARGSRYTSVGP